MFWLNEHIHINELAKFIFFQVYIRDSFPTHFFYDPKVHK